VTSSNALACKLQFNDNTNDVMSAWLGNNSEFSKAYKAGKCALDEALNNLPAEQRKVIANLIANSYSFSENNTKELLTYNY
ncbi:hypothetical protein OAP55_01100, partial [Alphaproteobacteria bacterium]|nr:hypothetical protein [Alphaproteobacteria bacterium]